MRVNRFSRLAALCISAAVCAQVGSAQTCQVRVRNLLSKGVSVGGFYSYSAIGNGLPGSLLTPTGTTGTGGPGTTGTSPSNSNTALGQLLGGIGTSAPFASSGLLFLDASGNILATPTTQTGVTTVVGSYVLNSSDCTITVTLRDAFTDNTTATTLQGIVVKDGSEIVLGALRNFSPAPASPGTGTSTPAVTNTLYGSNVLIRLVRQQAIFCSNSDLGGSFALISSGNRPTTVGFAGTPIGGSGTGTATGAPIEAPFFSFGLVQFDGNGGISTHSGSQSTLNFLQYGGSYTVNPDCTGTLTLNNLPAATGSSTTGTPSTGSVINFVLIQPSASRGTTLPELHFSQSTGTQTMFGQGIAQ